MDPIVGVCPSCGKPFKIEEKGGLAECEEVCANPTAMPTGFRLMADQATKVYVDGDMHELTRSDYIKAHGIDPEPLMEAVNIWRENQVRIWARQFLAEDEVDEWIRRLSKKSSI